MMSVRAYAKHRGVRHSAVQRAIEVGRLSRSVVRDAKGRPSITDVAEADREWEARTQGTKVSLSVQLAKAAGTVDERAPLVARLAELMAEVQADSHRAACEYLPLLVAAAAESLVAAGRPATPEALADALNLVDEDAGVNLTGELLEAVDDPDMSLAAVRELARRKGRKAVAWRCTNGTKGGADGNA